MTKPFAPRSTPLIILGAGGHAAVVIDAAQSAGWPIRAVLDDDPSSTKGLRALDLERTGPISMLPDLLAANADAVVHPAVGDNDVRDKWLDMIEKVGGRSATVIHPSAVVARSTIVKPGCFIAAGAVVNPRASIGRGCIINTAAVVEHDCIIGPYTHVAPRSVLGGHVQVGSHALIGIGSTVRPGVTVGDRATLGVGAVAVNDIPADVTALGCPARPR